MKNLLVPALTALVAVSMVSTCAAEAAPTPPVEFPVPLARLVPGALPTAFLARAQAAARGLDTALFAEGVGDVPEEYATALDDRGAWARRLFVWGYFEGGLLTNPPGRNDDGAACGVGQVHVESWTHVLEPAWSCAALRADRVLGFRAMYRVMRDTFERCGSERAGLAAYATGGACGGAVPALVLRRIRLAAP